MFIMHAIQFFHTKNHQLMFTKPGVHCRYVTRKYSKCFDHMMCVTRLWYMVKIVFLLICLVFLCALAVFCTYALRANVVKHDLYNVHRVAIMFESGQSNWILPGGFAWWSSPGGKNICDHQWITRMMAILCTKATHELITFIVHLVYFICDLKTSFG